MLPDFAPRMVKAPPRDLGITVETMLGGLFEDTIKPGRRVQGIILPINGADTFHVGGSIETAHVTIDENVAGTSPDVNSEEAARDSSSVVSADSSSSACHKTRLVKLGIIIDLSENGPRVAAVKSSK